MVLRVKMWKRPNRRPQPWAGTCIWSNARKELKETETLPGVYRNGVKMTKRGKTKNANGHCEGDTGGHKTAAELTRASLGKETRASLGEQEGYLS